MRRIINTIKNTIGIILDVPVLVLSACILPFAFVLYVLLSVPKIILSLCARHRVIFTTIITSAFFLVMLYDLYITNNNSDTYTFLEFVSYFLEYSLSTKPLFFCVCVLAVAILPCVFILLIYKTFLKLDGFIWSIYYAPLMAVKKIAKDIGLRFTLIRFGSHRRKELYEIRKFRKAYALAC